MTKDELFDYIQENMFNKNGQWKSTAHFKHIYDDINKYQRKGNTLQEKLYLFYYKKSIPTCPICGNETSFIKLSQGYRKYCSTTCSANSIEKQDKIKLTCKEKYGVEHITQTEQHKQQVKIQYLDNKQKIESAKIKRKQTNLDKYGVDNVSQLDEIKEKLSSKNWKDGQYANRQKAEQTKLKNLFSKYIKQSNETNIVPLFKLEDFQGVQQEYNWLCKNCETTFSHHLLYAFIPHCPKCYPKTRQISNQEKEVVEWIKSQGYSVIENDKSILNNFEVDIYLSDYNLAIEYNGVYWHSTKFKDKYYHYNKVKLANKKGIRLLHIWEYEWIEDKKLIQDVIQYYINNLQEEILPEEPKLYNIYDNLIWI